MTKRLRAAVIGFGKMADTYAQDPAMARHYRYAAHAQVLAEHPAFEWLAVVDQSAAARERAQHHWRVPHVAADAAGLGRVAEQIEVAVLATPPDARMGIIDALPSLRAVLVEKPLGSGLAESRRFLEQCDRRAIAVQVNLWRRADETFRRLAAGELRQLVGDVQCAFCVYGNGLLNNGTHMIDLVRMMLGEIVAVTAVATDSAFVEGPLEGDLNVAANLLLESGASVALLPLRFAEYRENGIDIWGQAGRLSILNEGLTILRYPRAANRAMSGEREIAVDAPDALPSSVGDALYRMFSNLAQAMTDGSPLCSPGTSALQTAVAVEAVLQSAKRQQTIALGELLAPVAAT
jgi:predicted dehydrogenase